MRAVGHRIEPMTPHQTHNRAKDARGLQPPGVRLAIYFGLMLLTTAVASAETLDRSPVDVALTSDERWLLSANETSGTVSLIDVAAGKVAAEIEVGGKPAFVTISADDRRALVPCTWSGDLVVLALADGRLTVEKKIPLGFEPYGAALAADGRTAYIALSTAATVAVVDLEQGHEIARIEVGKWPRYLALSPDGSRLAVTCSGSQTVAVVDTAKQAMLYEETTNGINLGHVQVSADGKFAYLPWMVYRTNPINARNIRLGWVLGTRIGRLRMDGPSLREAITLDPPGMAVSDPHGLALTRDGRYLVSTGSGTHELLVYRTADMKFQSTGGPGDHIDPALLRDREKFFRVPLGGRPMGVRVSADGQKAFVANYLTNAVQVVDLHRREVTQTIDLGGPSEPSLARRGAAIFYDGRRSLDQWYSCHSCHWDGGTNAVAMDTHNDRSDYTFKTAPSLAHAKHTGPWTWHGWQQSLEDACRTSMIETMLGPEPTADDTVAVAAFLDTLDDPPNSHRQPDGSLSAAALRGQAVFQSETAGCATCHTGPYFTDNKLHDVGLSGPRDKFDSYNTPSLRGLSRRVRYLHDGRAKSLEALLTGPHNPAEVVGRGELTEAQRRDLIEYLKSL